MLVAEASVEGSIDMDVEALQRRIRGRMESSVAHESTEHDSECICEDTFPLSWHRLESNENSKRQPQLDKISKLQIMGLSPEEYLKCGWGFLQAACNSDVDVYPLIL